MSAAALRPKPTVLVVSRDPTELAQAGTELTYHGYPNHLATSGTEALCELGRGQIDVVLLSTHLPDALDLGEMMRWVRTHHPSVRIQIMGGTSLVRLKAYVDEADGMVPRDAKIVPWLVALVEQTHSVANLPPPLLGSGPHSDPTLIAPPPFPKKGKGEVEDPRAPGELALRDQNAPTLLGRSPSMLKLKAVLPTAAQLKRVLVRGEAGTGKENVVQMIHWLSQRRGPLVAFNAGELVDSLGTDTMMGHEKGAHSGATSRQAGAFEEADDGTLFVDEIADMSLPMQVKFLRVLETGEVRRLGASTTVRVDVLFVVATNKDLKREVAEGRFRQDLYDRLTDFVVEIPPLRERPSDIPELAQHFANLQCGELGWPDRPIELSALGLLKRASYPGNLRQLRSTVRRAVVIGGQSATTLSPAHIKEAFEVAEGARQPVPDRVPEPMRVREDRARAEAISDALDATANNLASAARVLGVGRSHLYREMSRLGVAPPGRSASSEREDPE